MHYDTEAGIKCETIVLTAWSDHGTVIHAQ